MGKLFLMASGGYAAYDSAMLEVVLQAAKDSIAVILPIVIGLFIIILGLDYIPMIINRFKYGGYSSLEAWAADNDIDDFWNNPDDWK